MLIDCMREANNRTAPTTTTTFKVSAKDSNETKNHTLIKIMTSPVRSNLCFVKDFDRRNCVLCFVNVHGIQEVVKIIKRELFLKRCQ